MIRLHACLAAILLALAVAPAAVADEPLPAGDYALDRAHASLIFRVDHLGFSMFTARFTRFDAALFLDPADPATARLTATVETASIETDYPDPENFDFNAHLLEPEWLDGAAHPEIVFHSHAIELTGPDSADIHGALSMRGRTHPLTLSARFNGGWAGQPYDPQARIGFSARGALSRSAYGVDIGVPEPGSTLGVGDTVEIVIEAEFTGPAWAGAAEE